MNVLPREAWLIEFTDTNGEPRRAVHLCNSIGDYRMIDQDAVVVRLTDPSEFNSSVEAGDTSAHADNFRWELRDILVAASSAFADRDYKKGQAYIGEALQLLSASQLGEEKA